MTNRDPTEDPDLLHGVMKRAKRIWKLPQNPVATSRSPSSTARDEIEVFSPRR